MYNLKLVGWEDPKRIGLGFEACNITTMKTTNRDQSLRL
jgi:hypothetical protein